MLGRWSRVLAVAPVASSLAPQGVVAAGGYAKTSLVVVVEAVKIVVSVAFLAAERGKGLREAWGHLVSATRSQPLEVLRLSVPSALYVLQNNLVLVAADNVEGPVIAVLGQLKIVSTAAFSVGLLGRSLHARQWAALVALVAGVSAVQLSIMTPGRVAGAGAGLAGDGGHRNSFVGAAALCGASLTSGFAGVYFEKVLKGSDLSVWVRNVHMAGFGVALGLGGLFTQPGDLALVAANGFFGGYTSVAWALVAVQAGGGLLVAAVVK
jgi:UDP-sugar transporter A1/2/3